MMHSCRRDITTRRNQSKDSLRFYYSSKIQLYVCMSRFNKTVPPSANRLVVSACVQTIWRWVRWQSELPLIIFIFLSYTFSARHVATRLFNPEVLYISSPTGNLLHKALLYHAWCFSLWKRTPNPFTDISTLQVRNGSWQLQWEGGRKRGRRVE